MAINYLNSIDLNKNELLQGVIENQPNDAAAGSSPVTGQVYYNTTDFELRQYNGTGWVSVGDITSLTPGTNISIDNPATSSPTINVIDAPTFAGNLTISKVTPKLIITDTVASDLKLEISQQGSTTSFTSRGGTSSTGQFNFRITNGSTTTNALFINQQARATFAGDVVIDGGDITLGGTGRIQGVDTVTDGTDAANKTYVDNAITAAAYTFDIGADTGTDQGVASGDIVDIAGSANIGTAVSIVNSKPTVTVSLGDSVSIGGDFDADGEGTFGGAVSIDGDLNMNSNQINDLLDPSTAQDAATKNYVDNAIVGGLVYQGGYNAATNTPNLDSNPSPNLIKKGWTYTVTADGLFFTEQVRVGDVLIAENNAPTTLAEWTTVQNNIDLADGATIGIGNVAASTDVELLGINVAYDNPTSGTAHVGLDIDGLPSNTLPSQAGDVSIPFVDDTSGTNAKATLEDLIVLGNSQTSNDGEITAGSLSGTVTHNWGTEKVIVQTYKDNATDNYPTVFCDITRTSNAVTATIASAETDDIIILVQKIG